jgi:hypothetical protein
VEQADRSTHFLWRFNGLKVSGFSGRVTIFFGGGGGVGVFCGLNILVPAGGVGVVTGPGMQPPF